jgi:hypothetical protein
MSSSPPGWYPDPRDPLRERLWDGSDWVDRTRPHPPQHNPAPLPLERRPSLAPPEPQVSHREAHPPPTQPEVSTTSRRLVMGSLSSMVLADLFSALVQVLYGHKGYDLSSNDTYGLLSGASSLLFIAALTVFLVTCARHATTARTRLSYVPHAVAPAVVLAGLLCSLWISNVIGVDIDPVEGSRHYIILNLTVALGFAVIVALGLLQTGSEIRDDRRALVGWGVAFSLWGSLVGIASTLYVQAAPESFPRAAAVAVSIISVRMWNRLDEDREAAASRSPIRWRWMLRLLIWLVALGLVGSFAIAWLIASTG